MLTREHALFEYKLGKIVPDRLTRKCHAGYLELADRMLDIYRSGAGRTRAELHWDVHRLFDTVDECPARRISSFCKLLDDASTFATDKRGEAARLRSRIFRLAAPAHPLVRQADRFFEKEEGEMKREISEAIQRPWQEIERVLFADVIDFHRLEYFHGYADGRALLSRYNVGQVQVALFKAVDMQVWARQDLKTLLRYARLAGLMHTTSRLSDGTFLMKFDGPASVLRQTRRYGVGMARFLPALLSCRDWRLQARIETHKPGWTVTLAMTSEDGLASHLPPPQEFDSWLEEDFARKWGKEPREGWTLAREGDILMQGQKAFFPDFTFVHEDGRKVLLEIIGFWTPKYLKAKAETLRSFNNQLILLAVAEDLSEELPDVFPHPVIHYKSVLKVRTVLNALEELSAGSSGERAGS